MQHPKPIWQKEIGTGSDEQGHTIATDHHGNVFIYGYTFGGNLVPNGAKGYYDCFLAKYSARGEEMWRKQLGTYYEDMPTDMTVDATGSVIISGYVAGVMTEGPGSIQVDGFVAKYTPTGLLEWTKKIRTTQIDWVVGVEVDQDDNVLICGYTGGELVSGEAKGDIDIFIAKYRPDGTEIWIKQIGTSQEDRAACFALDQAGNMFIGQAKTLIVSKYDTEANLLWSVPLGTPDPWSSMSVATDTDNHLIVYGTTRYTDENGASRSRTFISKRAASNGDELWRRPVGIPFDNPGRVVAVDAMNSILIAGVKPFTAAGQTPKEEDYYAFFAKYDSEGELLWTERLGKAINYSFEEETVQANGIAVDHLGHVFIGGSKRLKDQNPDILVAKYRDIPTSKGTLAVPLHLKGIYVEKSINTVGATTDFTYLPWNDGQRDHNPDYAPLGEYLETKPLQSTNGELQPGIHLHWTLPSALCRPVKSNNGEDQYPFVPVQWNIVPIDGSSSGNKTLWSDYLHPSETPLGTEYAAVPVPHRSGAIPYRYMGKATDLRATAPDGDFYTDENHLNKGLTCLGYGALSFASYYPDCREVFGHHEPLEQVDTTRAVTYFVSAILYEEGDDSKPLNQLMMRTELSLEELLQQFNWPYSTQRNLPEKICLTGAVRVDPTKTADQAISTNNSAVKFSLGNTGTEALSTLLAQNLSANHGNVAKMEEQLEAILLQEKIEGKGADLGLEFLEERHSKGFRKIGGGTRWSLQPLDFGPERGELLQMQYLNAEDHQTLQDQLTAEQGELQQQIDAADTEEDRRSLQAQIDKKERLKNWFTHLAEICDELIQLNLSQHKYEVERRKVTSMQTQLFTDWYKYMLAKYPPPESLAVFETSTIPDSGEIAAWLQQRALAIFEQHELTGELILATSTSLDPNDLRSAGTPESCSAEVERNLRTVQETQTTVASNTPGTRLLHRPAAPFYLPAEPVLLVAGLNIPAQETQQAEPTTDHYVAPEIIEGKSGAELEKALFAALYPDRSVIPENDPWNPFILEWEAEFLPLIDNTGVNATKNRFTLQENQPDTMLSVPESYKHIQSTVIRGRTFLTPGAKARKMAVLADFLKHKLPALVGRYTQVVSEQELMDAVNNYIADQQAPHDTNNAVLTAARAYQELDEMVVLSQALSGFNDGLLQLSHHLQPNLYDPLGTDQENSFSQTIGELIGNSTKKAPNPANPFLPIRAGSFRLVGIRLIDAWGRYRDLVQASEKFEPALPQTLTPYSGKPSWAGLPLRVAQPLRLHFDWLAAYQGEGQDVSLDQIPFASPVLGWVLANHLDRNLMYFDADGQALGYYNRQAEHALPPGVANVGATSTHVQHLLNHIAGNPDWMQAFLDVTDNAAQQIAPSEHVLHTGMAMLTGKPMAVVRVRLSFELLGIPAENRSWEVLKDHLKQLQINGVQAEPAWQNMKFPIRLGNYMKLNDGLLGFWVENEQGQLQGPLYTMAEETNRSDILPHNNETLLWLPLNGQSITLTLLIDPRSKVHATSGILPVKSLQLQAEFYNKALMRLNAWFLSAPLLQPKDASSVLYASLPPQAGYEWSWVEAANDHNQTTADPQWEEHRDFLSPVEKAHLEKDSELREGWLKLNHQ